MPPETRQTDFETSLLPLWVRAQAGDEVAYRESLACIAARVRGYARRRLQGPRRGSAHAAVRTLMGRPPTAAGSP